MKTLKSFAAGFLAFLLTLTPLAASAQIPLLGAGKQRSSAAGNQTSVWSAAASAAVANGSTFSTTLVANDTVIVGVLGGTDISTFAFPSNQSGKWFWQVKLIALNSTFQGVGISAVARNTYIGNFGTDTFTLAMRPNGIFTGGVANPQQTGVNITAGTVVDLAVDLATAQVWWSTDGATWWGAGGSNTNTLADVVAGVGGWDNTNTNIIRYPASTWGGTMQLIAGSNITRSPPTGFTVIP